MSTAILVYPCYLRKSQHSYANRQSVSSVIPPCLGRVRHFFACPGKLPTNSLGATLGKSRQVCEMQYLDFRKTWASLGNKATRKGLVTQVRLQQTSQNSKVQVLFRKFQHITLTYSLTVILFTQFVLLRQFVDLSAARPSIMLG